MPDASSSALYASRPAIRVAGQDDADLSAGLMSLVIAETVSGIYRCEALFGNWGAAQGATGFLYFDRNTLDFGKALQISLGNDVLFDGRITALEARFPEAAPPQISVLAEDRLQDLRMTRRSRSFADSSDSDVFRQIASDHGLTAQIDLTGPTHKFLAQVNQSDLAFLRDRARAIGAEVWVKGSELHAAARGSRSQGTPLEMAIGGKLREFSVIADLASQRSSVSVSGWDVAGKSGLASTAGASAISSELEGGESGPSVLSSALGERKEAIAHATPMSSDEARAEAEAVLRLLARRFVVGRGLAQTDASLRVGGTVDLKGLGPLFSGKYYTAQVQHHFDSTQGIRSEFVCERPALGRP